MRQSWEIGCHNNIITTIFIQIVAAATINFSLAWMWLLIEGGSSSRVAYIILQHIHINFALADSMFG